MSTENGESDLNQIIVSVRTGGALYEMVIGDFSALDEGDFERVTGRDIMSVFVSGDVNSRTIAALVWLHRRRYERKLSYEAVAKEFKWSDLQTLDIRDGSENDDEENDAREATATAPES